MSLGYKKRKKSLSRQKRASRVNGNLDKIKVYCAVLRKRQRDAARIIRMKGYSESIVRSKTLGSLDKHLRAGEEVVAIQ